MTCDDAYKKLLEKKQALEEEFRIYQSLVKNSSDLFYRTNMQGIIIYVSPSVYNLSGYTVQEATGMNMAKEVYLFPEQRNDFLDELMKNGEVTNFEAQLKRKDGTTWWAATNAKFFKDNTGNIAGIEGITRDISELKKANRALHESEELFRMAFHTSPDSINLNRLSDGLYIDINQGFTDLTGYTHEDVHSKTSLEIKIWEDIRDRERLVKGLTRNGYVKNLEARFVKKNGSVILGLMSASVLRIKGEDVILSIARDISDLKRAQEIMVQSEKMMSVGGLAAGMAHEINNPLAGIIQNSQVILQRLKNTDLKANRAVADDLGIDMNALTNYMEQRKIIPMAEAVKDTGSRIALIVDNMLSFARKSHDQVSSYSVTDLLDRTVELAGTDFDLKKHYDFKKIKIEKSYEKNLPLIVCEANKLQQVFLNILSNGAQAMQEACTPNPVFSIRTWLDTSAKMICIEIKDNGPGMDTATKKRVFEPFFTTKPVGIGTGLGMSISYFIITKTHKGKIEVHSHKGDGTAFVIYLNV